MKNVLLIFNVVLLAAVGYLYYHSFAGNKSVQSGQVTKSTTGATIPEVCRIAYFNMDSVENAFNYYVTSKAKFDKLKEDNNRVLDALAKKYNDRLMELQQKATSQEDMEKARQELDGMMQRNQQAKSDIENKLYTEGNRMNEDVLAKISEYLKAYNSPKKYDYIIVNEPRLVFYKDSTLNITTDLIKGLNEKYPKSKN